MEEVTQVKKTYQTVSGPFAWLADIEITKGPYLAAFGLMVLGLVLVRRPFFEISLLGESIASAFQNIEELKWMGWGIIVLNIASIAALVFPLLKFFEWKYRWFVLTGMSAVVELGALLYFVVRLREELANTVVGAIYNFLSAEVNITFTGWLLIMTVFATLVCSVKMLLDIMNLNK